MTNKTTHKESKMLEAVRRWRAEAYEADRNLDEEARHRRAKELSERFGIASSSNNPTDTRQRKSTRPR